MGKPSSSQLKRLTARQRLDKYRIERRLDQGTFASVYKAFDTIEGIYVALKIPHRHLTGDEFMKDFRKEVRLAAKLDHDNILPVKNASFVNGYFVIVLPLGEESLANRLQRRISLRRALDFGEQALNAVAFAHGRKIMHCDIKPENFILFPNGRLRLTDFGIAKLSLRTIQGSGTGTIGYVAPEQAMGRPSCRSDVFSLGLLLYRMLSGRLPTWPFEWPPPGYRKIRKRVHPDMIALIEKSLKVKPSKRFKDACRMYSAFRKIKPRTLRYQAEKGNSKKPVKSSPHWQEIRKREFEKRYKSLLETSYTCRACGGPVSEPMFACPWCGSTRKTHRDTSRFPARCPRCKRGVKLDWKYCPWCYGPKLKHVSQREYTDVRYSARCPNPKCPRSSVMPFMRYCPWCHRALRREWKIPNSKDRCPSCNWGVLFDFWSYCPWCGEPLLKR